jgi:hypothetical protein
MDVSPGSLKVTRMRLRVADERNAFLCHRRVVLERKRINWRSFSQHDAEMLAFVERRISSAIFRTISSAARRCIARVSSIPTSLASRPVTQMVVGGRTAVALVDR